MDGFKAFKLYTAIKLHFTNPKFDVFVNRGRVRGSYETFNQRNDRLLFERLARQCTNERELIKFIAANFMYHNPNFVYSDDGEKFYKEYNRRRQSITRIFEDDLTTVGCTTPSHLIQIYLRNEVTLEFMVIINEFEGTFNKLKSIGHLNLMFNDELLILEKSRKFVHFDMSRVEKVYKRFQEDTTQPAFQPVTNFAYA